jgi:hypothetical protein
MSLLLSNPSNRHKWFIIVSCGVVLILGSLGVALHRALSSPPRFRASSLVLITPTSSTKAVLAESFQARAFQSMPGVHLERQGSAGLIEVVAYAATPRRPAVRAGPGGAAGLIEIVAYAATAAEAQTNANQAFYPLARAGMETFGAGFRMSILRPAMSARRTSIFHP